MDVQPSSPSSAYHGPTAMTTIIMTPRSKITTAVGVHHMPTELEWIRSHRYGHHAWQATAATCYIRAAHLCVCMGAQVPQWQKRCQIHPHIYVIAIAIPNTNAEPK